MKRSATDYSLDIDALTQIKIEQDKSQDYQQDYNKQT